MRDTVIGVDLGTSGVKAGCFDHEGRPITITHASYPREAPQPGWAQQNAEDWWDALAAALRQLARKGADPASVAAVAVGGQAPCMTPLDDGFRPVAPALIWSDTRAGEEAAQLSAASGTTVAPNALIAKSLWLSRHDPDAFRRCRWILGCGESAIAHLCGVAVALHPLSGELVAASGLDEGLFGEHVPPGTVVGSVTEEAAAATGLRAGTPVVSGWVDSFMGIIGSGVVAPGQACLTGGSAGTVTIVCREEPGRSYAPYAVGGHRSVSTILSGTGLALEWFHDQLAPDASYESLLAEAAQAPAGAGGAAFFLFPGQTRAASAESTLGGAWTGLDASHERRHLVRALLEGVAFAYREALEELESRGVRAVDVRHNGGQTRSAFWNQVKADVLGRPMAVPEVTEAGALGAAILASVAVGWYADVPEAAGQMVRLGATYEPDAEHREVYEQLLARRRELMAAIRAAGKQPVVPSGAQ